MFIGVRYEDPALRSEPPKFFNFLTWLKIEVTDSTVEGLFGACSVASLWMFAILETRGGVCVFLDVPLYALYMKRV